MKLEHVGLSFCNKWHKLIITVPITERDNVVELADKVNPVDKDAEYTVEIKKKRTGRSLDANSYYWVLIDRLSKAIIPPVSKEIMHNMILARYGVDWLDKDENHVYVLMKDDDRYLEFTDQHYRPTDKTEKRGQSIYRWYILLKPTHLYDSKEFSTLLDGLISECDELGIETESPEWIERVKSLWKSM